MNKINSNRKKIGFTIPEILLTLVVIGVSAALTIPSMINNYGEHERIAKISKFYSNLNMAIETSVAKGEDYSYYTVVNSSAGMKSFFDSFLKSTLSVMNVCSSGDDTCWYGDKLSSMSGSEIDLGSNVLKFTMIDGTNVQLVNADSGKFNTLFGISKEPSEGLAIVFDINGAKKPNVIGEDIFAAVFTVDDGIVPAYYGAEDSVISSDCSKSGTGFSCIQKYLQNDVNHTNDDSSDN